MGLREKSVLHVMSGNLWMISQLIQHMAGHKEVDIAGVENAIGSRQEREVSSVSADSAK
jgi:hypothetical protein